MDGITLDYDTFFSMYTPEYLLGIYDLGTKIKLNVITSELLTDVDILLRELFNNIGQVDSPFKSVSNNSLDEYGSVDTNRINIFKYPTLHENIILAHSDLDKCRKLIKHGYGCIPIVGSTPQYKLNILLDFIELGANSNVVVPVPNEQLIVFDFDGTITKSPVCTNDIALNNPQNLNLDLISSITDRYLFVKYINTLIKSGKNVGIATYSISYSVDIILHRIFKEFGFKSPFNCCDKSWVYKTWYTRQSNHEQVTNIIDGTMILDNLEFCNAHDQSKNQMLDILMNTYNITNKSSVLLIDDVNTYIIDAIHYGYHGLHISDITHPNLSVADTIKSLLEYSNDINPESSIQKLIDTY